MGLKLSSVVLGGARAFRTVWFYLKDMECNCIVTRGGVYDEISPEPEGNPERILQQLILSIPFLGN